ncbi:uncharacterized protein FIESC28_08636 [Fusarium coffeatum]|uniref:Transcription factor domain-containing protein n=1 Tax=Fusarium coffeatum TaxID=231269 RepID=A0A366R6K4_9HYPO|nr:uncharacterized protein FIESC28_08636 [Fusarium coffeatum]RBR12512.1 hypothetical protein FIESC28_08636 [Fusarium coffeatum]
MRSQFRDRVPVQANWDFPPDHVWVRSSAPFKFIDDTELIVDGYLVIVDDKDSSPMYIVKNRLHSQAVLSPYLSTPGQPKGQGSNPDWYLTGDTDNSDPVVPSSPVSRNETPPGHYPTTPLGNAWGDFLNQPPTVSLTANEAALLQRFAQVVGQWMDLSDLSQTWSKLVPRFATRANLVKECCVACAAKQLALSTPQTPKADEWMRQAQASYSIAIEQLIRQVSIDCPAPSPETFVATVLCSVYEMIDATGSDWQAHLEGISQIGDDSFDTIYFTLGTAASAWQMYHLCNILLLTSGLHQGCQSGQEIQKKLRSHALQICGVALGEPDGGARVHSVQAIYYEEDLGWAAKYRVRDLYVAWERERESPAYTSMIANRYIS